VDDVAVGEQFVSTTKAPNVRTQTRDKPPALEVNGWFQTIEIAGYV
jgi:hypothetical protein